MTQDEIIRMAQEAGISEWAIGTGENRSSTQGRRLLRLERFAALVAEAERETVMRLDTALREALAQPQVAPDGRVAKTVFTFEDMQKATEMGYESGKAEAEALAQPQCEWVDLTPQEKANIIYAADHRNPMVMLNEAISLLIKKNTTQVCKHGCDDNACPECYFEHTEPIAKVCHDLAGHIGWNPDLDELPEEGALLYTTPPVVPQGEPVAWMYQFKTEDPLLFRVKRDWADNHSQWKETPLYTTPPSVEAAIERERLMGYASGQMAVEAMRIETLEKAANICDRFQERDVGMQPAECAAAIRSMK